jgi:hypothetical protein
MFLPISSAGGEREPHPQIQPVRAGGGDRDATKSRWQPFSIGRRTAMAINELQVSNGPDKADLISAVANPAQHLHVTFDTSTDPVEAHLDVIEEIGVDGVTFGLRGYVASGNLRGAVFSGVYNSSSRTGKLVLKQV